MGDSSDAKKIESGPPAAMGKYSPFARLGNGGMADVFLAVANGPVGFRKLAVIKRLRNAGDDAHVQMFLDEARLSARLSHPNIVNTYEVGESNGNFFIAMEYLEGQTLQALVTAAASGAVVLSDTLIAYIASQALKALHYAHELADFDGTPIGVVHRDVSPHNIFVTYGGEVKLLDFGIAKANVNSSRTETGVLKGKVRYMAPEQALGDNADRRIDVFAFGVVLWEMLARRALFTGESYSVLTKIATQDAPLLRTVRPDTPPALEAIVARALQRDRANRYATAEAMRVEIDQYLRGKQDDASDDALARLMSESFAEMRAKVRDRVKTYLAMRTRTEDDTATEASISSTTDLPVLLADGSGPRRAPSLSDARLSTSDPNAVTRGAVRGVKPRRTKAWVLGAVTVVALAGAGIALGSRGDAPQATKGAVRDEAHAPSAPPVTTLPVPSVAHFLLATTPPGALVEVNGTPAARTPSDLTLAPGAQSVTLSLAGFASETLTLDVVAGSTIDKQLTLHALTPAPSVIVPPRSAPVLPRAQTSPIRALPASDTAAREPAAPSGTSRPNIKVLE